MFQIVFALRLLLLTIFLNFYIYLTYKQVIHLENIIFNKSLKIELHIGIGLVSRKLRKLRWLIDNDFYFELPQRKQSRIVITQDMGDELTRPKRESRCSPTKFFNDFTRCVCRSTPSCWKQMPLTSWASILGKEKKSFVLSSTQIPFSLNMNMTQCN